MSNQFSKKQIKQTSATGKDEGATHEGADRNG